MQTRIVHWRSPVAATLLLILLIAIASAVITTNVINREEDIGFQRLANEAEEFASLLELNMDSDRRQLELIAGLAGNYSDVSSAKLLDFLSQYPGNGNFFSRIELLLPGDVVISSDGGTTDVSGRLSFEAEAALGAHISDRETDLDGSGYVVRHFVPVYQDGETVAMLYGVIDIGTLGDELPYEPYDGSAAVYVIDGATGDFLIDTWHDEPGNIWAEGSRPMASGYDDAQLRQGLIDGESNYVVFVSNTTDSYLYFYYMPVSINQWRVAMSVPEEVVFADANSVRSMLGVLLALESVGFMLYLLWLILYVRRETGEKQRQLDALSYIYDVEKLLFNAHIHPENVPKALEIVGKMLPAERVSFTIVSGGEAASSYVWEDGGAGLSEELSGAAPALADYFSRGGGEVSAHTAAEVRAVLPGAPEDMSDLAAIPIEDAGGAIRGVLSAAGLGKRKDCTAMLRSVGFSFSMLYSNARTYKDMQRMGEGDALTGLYNRNRYELDLPNLPGECRESLCCVFVDANGLHELNNSQGHEAGDNMLRSVAEELLAAFGSRHTYRVGGDEFVVFVCDEPEDETGRRVRETADALRAKGCFVSAGFAWAAAPVDDVERVIKSAEERMYAEKRRYYQDPSNDRRERRRI